MVMVVTIVNITDAPESKKTPTRLAIYTAHLDPGEELKLPASMVDARLRKLETDGYIVIGQLPSWYHASKAKKHGQRSFTHAELEKHLTTKPKAPEKAEAERYPSAQKKKKWADSTADAPAEDKKTTDEK